MQAQTVKSTLHSPHAQAVSAPSLAWAGSVRKRRASVAEEEDAGPSPAKTPGGSLLQTGRAGAAVEAAAEQHQDGAPSHAEQTPKAALLQPGAAEDGAPSHAEQTPKAALPQPGAAEAAAQRAATAAPEAVGVGSAGGGRPKAPTLIDQAEILLRTGLSETSNIFIIGAVIVSVLFLLGMASVYMLFGGKGRGGEASGRGADDSGSSFSVHRGRGGAGLETALAAPGAKAGPSAAALSRLHPPVAGHGAHLCSDLVVPRNCECVLLVPISPIGPRPFEITDALGKPVLFVSLAPDTGPSKPRFMLTAADGTTLARFGPAEGQALPEAPDAEFVISRSQGDVFAHLQRSQNQDRYTLATRLGMRLDFCGSFHQRAVNVTDVEGRLLATTEPSAELSVQRQDAKRHQHYLLRVAPLMDVGLVLCGLLCIDGGAKQR